MDGPRNDIKAVIKALAITTGFVLLVSVLMAITGASAKPNPVKVAKVAVAHEVITTSTTIAPVAVSPDPMPTQPAAQPAASGCFLDLARSVGWPEDSLAHLGAIIERESHCDPASNTGYRPSTGDWSLGLLQINTLGDLLASREATCGISTREQLLDPTINLACGLALYRASGFGPWGG